MTSLLNPAVWWAVIVGLPLMIVGVVAACSDRAQFRYNRRNHIVADFCGLRITASHLIVGQSKDAERIPLAGLAVALKQTESATGADVVVTIRGAVRIIERREPLSYGTGGQAQIFAVMFNRMTSAQSRMAAIAPISA